MAAWFRGGVISTVRANSLTMRRNVAAPATAAREDARLANLGQFEVLAKARSNPALVNLALKWQSVRESRPMRVLIGVFLRVAVFIFISASSISLRAQTHPFQPIRALSAWYTDRAPIDIEIVGSDSMLPEFHHLESERDLRFRIERAYVEAIIAKSEPGFEIVHFSFDMETGLPSSLFFAVANKGKFHEDIPGIAVIPNAEMIRRTLRVSFSSDASAAALQHSSEFYRTHKCQGAVVGNGLSTFEWKDRPDCQRTAYPNGAIYLADYDGGLALRLECQEESFPGIGCMLSFPFEGFAAEIAFNRDHLRDWRGLIDRAKEFLRANQYH
jgi:hypothetical protein